LFSQCVKNLKNIIFYLKVSLLNSLTRVPDHLLA